MPPRLLTAQCMRGSQGSRRAQPFKAPAANSRGVRGCGTLHAGMSQQVDSLEASSRYPQPEGSHERKVAALRADIRDIQASLQEMQANER